MLIYTSRYRGAGKQKIAQYGPASFVRSSVMRNAEDPRILGVDPQTFLNCMPAWELAGTPKSVIGADFYDGSNTWYRGGYKHVKGGDYLKNTAAELAISIFTIVFGITALSDIAAESSDFTFIDTGTDDVTGKYHLVVKLDAAATNRLQIFTTTGIGTTVKLFGGTKTDWSAGEYQIIITRVASAGPKVFVNGIEDVATTSNTTVPKTSYFENWRLFHRVTANSNVSAPSMILNQQIITNNAFNENQIVLTKEQPYALWQPNPATVYFDLGAGGTTNYQSVAGAMPAPSGAVAAQMIFAQLCAGTVGSISGGLAKKIFKQTAGDFPAATALLHKVTSRSFSGNLPAPSGSIATVTGLTQTCYGVAGSISGAITKSVKKSLAGVFDGISGLLRKKTSKGLAGSMPGPAGAILKKVKISVSGIFPALTGTLEAGARLIQSVQGTCGAISGSVSGVFDAGGAIIRSGMRLLGSRLRKFLG